MKTDKVYNLIILDESGSMESIKQATISGFNELVQTIRGIETRHPEQQHFVSLVTFNGLGVKTILDKAPVDTIKEIDPNSYKPGSLTPLYDAIGISVLRLRIDVAGIENVHVLVTILTDGNENASQEFSHEQVKKIIDEQKNLGWTFTYLGANHDVEKVAHSISITNTMNFRCAEESVGILFAKESAARIRFSDRIGSLENKESYYSEDPVKEDGNITLRQLLT
jgi:hypothetical protein